MSESNPKISVIMAVYNDKSADLKASIESILAQRVTDFEFIIINDGSTDPDILNVLEEYAEEDKRISLSMHENKGLTKSLNIGIKMAKGDYIARQDADDVSYPARFEKQLKIFENNPDIVLVGGNCKDHYPDGHSEIWGSYDDTQLQSVVFQKAPFAHSTVMMKTETCRALGGYDESFKTAQDTEFWMRFASVGKLGMVKDPVLLRNITAGSISHKRRWRQFYDGFRGRWRHNRGIGRVYAVYYSVRGLIIGLLPHRFIQILKRKRNIG